MSVDREEPNGARDDSAERDGARHASSEAPWSRLDSRMLAIAVARIFISILPIALAFIVFGADLDRGVRTALIAALAVGVSGAVSEAFRWWTARYRVTEDRVELRSGLFTREARWVPRDRIRTVDLKSGPLQRPFGLCVVRIGTGRQTGQGAGLRLDAIRRQEGEQLRTELLSTEVAAPAEERLLAQFRPSRVPYSLLSWWTFGLPAVVLGGIYQLLSTAGVRPDERELIELVTERFSLLPFPAALTLVVAVLVILGAFGAAAFSFETWWRYRLERRPREGILALRHGLVTLRSKDLEERRMRGVELVETIPLRPAAGAELRAIMTGLTRTESPWGARAEALGPSMSRAEAAGIAGELVGAAEGPTDADRLARHPAAALRRRRLRGVAAAIAATALLLVVGRLTGLVASGSAAITISGAVLLAVTLVAGLWAARDAHRNLGNRLTSRHLIVRSGLLSRRTAVLERDGIVGWTFRATLFQRRLGLITPTATTAAGRSAYSAPDMDRGEAVELADRTTPGLLTPFLAE